MITPSLYSTKKIADCEVFNKFINLADEKEKFLIVNIPLKYSKKMYTQERYDKFIDQCSKKFESLNLSSSAQK